MKAKTSQTDLIFQALASRIRRQILDLIKDHPGCCVNDVSERFDVSRIAIMKQLNVLVQAQLVISKKAGRKRELYFNAAPIQMIYDRWTTEYAAFWATQAVDLKYRVEMKSSGRQRKSSDAAAKKKSSRKPMARKKKATK